MKSRAFKTVALVILLPFLVAGCADMSPTLKGGAVGAGVGAATGAAAGAIIDGGSGAGKGAAVGAIVGGLAGILYGESVYQQQQQQARANAPRPQSESYSTTLPSPSPQVSDMPLLIADRTANTNSAMSRQAMLLMKELLSSNGIKFEDYNISSAAKYPKSPTVALVVVYYRSPSITTDPASGYTVNLRLSRADMESQYFSAIGSTLKEALSKALFGK